MAKTPKAKPTESAKKAPAKKVSIKNEEPKIEPVKKTYGTYMDENGVIDWDKLKASLK